MSDNHESYYKEPRLQSQVKANIVVKYFLAWSKVIMPVAQKRAETIGYTDLYAGRGKFDSGEPSTPLLLLQAAIDDDDLRQNLKTVFNDKDPQLVHSLKEAIAILPKIELLKYPPIVVNQIVGASVAENIANRDNRPPTLTFIDPYGYKGLSVELFEATVKHWGCECIIFFNYNRINPAMNNDSVRDLIDEIFGTQSAEKVRAQLASLSPQEREELIVKELTQVLKRNDRLVSWFRFTTPSGSRTSHYLIHCTKNATGYKIMKEILSVYSSGSVRGVPSMEFNLQKERQPTLIEMSDPIGDLANELAHTFEGRTLQRIEIFNVHHIDRPYIKKNYKDALLQLERAGRIEANPANRKRNTFADNVYVTFIPHE